MASSLGYALGGVVPPAPIRHTCDEVATVFAFNFFPPLAGLTCPATASLPPIGPRDLLQSTSPGTFRLSFLRDTNHDGIADNDRLTEQQRQTTRVNAAVMSPVMDPPNAVIPGSILQTYHVSKIYHNQSIPKYMEPSEEEVSLNSTGNKVSFDTMLFGLITKSPKDGNKPLEYWMLVNTDNNDNTGADPGSLEKIGMPQSTKFKGADIVAETLVNSPVNVTGSAWVFRNGSLLMLPNDAVTFDVQRFFIFPFLC